MTYPSFTSGDILTAADMNAVGLWKITTVSATSGGTVNIAGCFSSTYARYRLIGTVVGNSATAYELGFRPYAGAGSPVATGYYWGITRVDIGLGASNVNAGNNVTYGGIGTIANNAGRGHFVLDISNIQAAQYTTWNSQATDTRSASGYGGISCSGTLSNTTQYDSIQFGYGIWGTGTISNLQIAVYGYRD